MLDKKSKDVLSFVISKYSGNSDEAITLLATNFDMHYTELNSLCLNLYNLGYLNDFTYANDDAPIKVYPSYKGLHYFETEKAEARKTLNKSVIIPVIVTLLTQLLLFLLKLLLPLIQQLF